MGDINEMLCELLGIKYYLNRVEKPDFFSPAGRIDLLKRLKEKGCLYEFLAKFAFPSDFIGFLLDDNGALARVALEYWEASHEP